MTEFLGRFHPVLVHLPIGILLLACFFLIQSSRPKYIHLAPAVDVMLFWGMISAAFSALTGWLLSNSGDYDEELVGWHQWMGIAVTVFAAGTWLMRKRLYFRKWQWPAAALLLATLMFTGHLGGSLTHGPDYLTAPMKELAGDSEVVVTRVIPNVQEAMVYNDIVQPIFQSKCYSCHGTAKQKGKLRMDKPEMFLKGGKNGEVIEPGSSSKSELIKRLLLPLSDDDHMPPKQKSQLTTQQVELLQWWIDQGADFSKKVKVLEQPEKIKPVLLGLQNARDETPAVAAIPEEPVEKADDASIKKLKELGVVVMPVAQGSNYLLANFITARPLQENDLALLVSLKKQLVWLKLGNTAVGDSALTFVAQCTQLTRLQLEHTKITDNGLAKLRSLERLQTLNLVGNSISTAGLLSLKGLKNLTSVYLYQTAVKPTDWNDLKKAFPATVLDSGGYSLPQLASDTIVL